MFGLFEMNGNLIQDGFYSAEDADCYAQAELNLIPGNYIIKQLEFNDSEYYDRESL
ncbi:hypothetical protein ACE1CI_03460 [Aerosakkonemataceae cyanobacterium BLCC-F50]|uniref:Uncharacterized protein n=1 Tax=Floridaenema flaviceps BLCC-F50 TaxID=3153642 RepID=A0ABV4XJU9_9CYAN